MTLMDKSIRGKGVSRVHSLMKVGEMWDTFMSPYQVPSIQEYRNTDHFKNKARFGVGLLLNEKSFVTRESFIVFFLNRAPISDISARSRLGMSFFGHEIRHIELRSTLFVSKFVKNWTNHKMILRKIRIFLSILIYIQFQF